MYTHYYCLVCHKLENNKQACIIFRTGFYKAEYPIGCCSGCRSQMEQVSFAACNN